jgi:isoleucyl-tRNA synthetase
MDAWYFNVDKVKNRLIETNEEINWIPETVKHGRFENWLTNARDWNISRNRYWSTPIPIWECDSCNERIVLGSIEEINQHSGVRLQNLHRQYMDEVTFTCSCCGGTMRRVPEVLDCWFESGSVPFAQKHYPFENKEWFESHFPSDFIVEYTGQIRCWFYYLHVLAVALFDKPAFQNCIVHGTILAKDGKKLSKSSKNYTDPMELMKSYGTDAFRLYLYQTNAMLIGDLLFDENGIQEAYQQIILPYWNACNFFISYANIDQIYPDMLVEPKVNDQLDKWILAKLYRAVTNITENMDQYQVNKYVGEFTSLVDGLTNWYIRRSRRRFWSKGMTSDKQEGYETLYYVLVNLTKLFAPVAPLMAEKIYRTLTSDISVHLATWPTIPDYFRDDNLLEQVDIIQKVIYLSRSIRTKNRIKNRQPLSELKVMMSNVEYNAIIDQFKEVIAEELNVKKITIMDNIEDVAIVKYAPNFNEIRNRYSDQLPNIIKAIKSGNFIFKKDKVILTMNGKDEEYEAEIVFVTYQAKEGQHIVSDSGIVVSLDLDITEELRREGIARDVIRNVQDARKQLGCDIMDYIVIELSDTFPKEWTEYLCNETMSYLGEVSVPATTFTITDNDLDICIKIALVNK